MENKLDQPNFNKKAQKGKENTHLPQSINSFKVEKDIQRQ